MVDCDFHPSTEIKICFMDPLESMDPTLKMYISHLKLVSRIGELGKLCGETISVSSHTSPAVFLLLVCSVIGSPPHV